jgi:serine/threonine protein kinase
MIGEQHVLALPAGYQLGKYIFKGLLGSGGFGITYLAEDTSLHRKVAIKEMLPNEFATRLDGTSVVAKTRSDKTNLEWARARFVDEGRALAACDHPNVVDVYEMIEANGTAYMVTKYEEGCDLESWLQNLTRRPTESELKEIILPLLSGLERVHRTGFLHRDIKPENIYITEDGRPVLLDFGSARQAIRRRSVVMTSIITPGYAPFEQYHEDGNQGEWTDIYALGAVVYRAATGKRPPEAIRRLADDSCERLAVACKGRYSDGFLKAVDHALRVKESERPQTVAAWREELGTKSEVEQGPVDAVKAERPGKDLPFLNFVRRNPKRIIGGTVLLSVLIGISVLVWVKPSAKENAGASVAGQDNGKMIDRSSTNDGKSERKNQFSAVPQSTPIAETSPPQSLQPVSPSPTPVPQPAIPPPSPAPMFASPTPEPAETPTANAAQIDLNLVGKWETKYGRAKGGRIETWELRPDGTYTLSGPINETGTVTTDGGKIHQSFESTNKTLELAYQVQDNKLVTIAPDGTKTEWYVPGTSPPSTPQSSKAQSSKGESHRRHNPETPTPSQKPDWQRFIPRNLPFHF